MVASPKLSKKQNVFRPVGKGEKLPILLKVAVIYGPNASGKTSLIEALGMISRCLGGYYSGPRHLLPASPFRFDKTLSRQPSCFEVHFIVLGVRYEFHFAITQQRITKEKLVFYPRGKAVLLYERTYNETSQRDVYLLGDALEVDQAVSDTWIKLTSPRMAFISQAVANSNESLQQLAIPFEWLSKASAISGSLESWAESSQELAHEHPGLSLQLAEFLQDVDVPITKIRSEKYRVSRKPLPSSVPNALSHPDEEEHIQTYFTHRTALGEADFQFHEESAGTRSLIGFWLPYSLMSDDGPETANRLLIVDELDSSLHPMIVERLVERHMNCEIDAQLIFTTHDTHLMKSGLLRRDQFWLTDRDESGATGLWSVYDFVGREGEDIEKRYFEGRYKGVPILRRTR